MKIKPNVEKMEKIKDVEGLIKALKHKDSDVREASAKALGEIKDKRAVEPLIQALKDKSRNVQDEATLALENINKGKRMEPNLAKLLQEQHKKRIYSDFVRAKGEEERDVTLEILKEVPLVYGEGLQAEAMAIARVMIGEGKTFEIKDKAYARALKKVTTKHHLSEQQLESIITEIKKREKKKEKDATKSDQQRITTF